MRRIALIISVLLVWLSTGCTSSDREYIRNHVVLVEKQKNLRQIPGESYR